MAAGRTPLEFADDFEESPFGAPSVAVADARVMEWRLLLMADMDVAPVDEGGDEDEDGSEDEG